MSINLSVPDHHVEQELRPRITVVGVGGAGGNAVNDMIAAELEGVEFLVVNTDAQALKGSNAERCVQMGVNITKGLGAGAKPEVGKAAAEESLGEILDHLEGSNMAFIAAGMGGGTGTGAAPIIAQAARERGILTVGVVTKPFHFEGVHRMAQAEVGIEELEQFVDTLIVIPNQNLFRVANEKTTFSDAFRMADEVLYSGVRGVTDLMVMPGMINLDFADIRSVMAEMGKAMMGTGEASGERRSLDAAESAIANPLLDDTSMKGAKGVLINITGGSDMTLFEVDEAANRIRSEVDEEAYIIFGSAFDEALEGSMRVSVVATGIDSSTIKRFSPAILGQMDVQQPVSANPTSEEHEAKVIKQEMCVDQEGVDNQPLIPVRHVESNVSELKATCGTNMDDTSEPKEDLEEEIANEHVELVTGSIEETPIGERVAVSKETELVQMDPVIPEVSMEDAFIPTPPFTGKANEAQAPSKPFAISDMMNGPQENSTDAIDPGISPKTTKLKAGSLFNRIMGAKAQIKDQSQPLDSKQNTNAVDAKSDISITSESTAPRIGMPNHLKDAQAEPPAGDGSILSSINIAEKSNPEPIVEEDLLDIPAFLRRQAN